VRKRNVADKLRTCHKLKIWNPPVGSEPLNFTRYLRRENPVIQWLVSGEGYYKQVEGLSLSSGVWTDSLRIFTTDPIRILFLTSWVTSTESARRAIIVGTRSTISIIAASDLWEILHTCPCRNMTSLLTLYYGQTRDSWLLAKPHGD
jgi:hypothetical protein